MSLPFWRFGRAPLIIARASRAYCCLLLSLSLSLLVTAAWAEQIRIPVKVQSTGLEQPSDYFTTLLVMALEASKTDNEAIDIIFSPREYSQARWVNMLQNDASNSVIWTMTDKEREQLLRPIRVPPLKVIGRASSR